ncbi:MAG: lipase family protein, partial [Propionicimonas sp.]|nr:lipase family protein [Propionicimonas sp.]
MTARRRPFTTVVARLPRWVRAVVALAVLVLGVVIITRPTTSLGVLAVLIGTGLVLAGVLDLTGLGTQAVESGWGIATAVVWIVAGGLVLGWPGLTVRLVAVVVGVSLVVNAVLTVASGLRGKQTLDARLAALAFGAAGLVFGVLALAWPDITLLVTSVVFGARLIMSGFGWFWWALGGGRTEVTPAGEPFGWRRWRRGLAALTALLLAVGAAVLSAALQRGSPVLDDFYAAPRDVPAEPGRLVRSEPFTQKVPADARAWRILYTSTRADGAAALGSAIVVEPLTPGSHPVIDWTHGTTGFAENCAPSILDEPFESGALMVVPELIDQGWAVVATDYIGLGTRGPHGYLVGAEAAHGALDAVRAARELPDAALGDQTVVWGHSQGGGAA